MNISSEPVDPHLYRSTVGALQYLTLTRPDIQFVVNRACQKMHLPQPEDWQRVKHLLRYLKGTITEGLKVSRTSTMHISLYSDADWAGSSDDRRSTSGFLIYLGVNLISWSSKKQQTVARSSTESEYKAVANATSELKWIQSLLREINLQIPTTPTLWCDNIGATYLAANPVFHGRMKHIEIDFHFVREYVNAGKLKIAYISTKDQLADILTKPLPKLRFVKLKTNLNVIPTMRLPEGIEDLERQKLPMTETGSPVATTTSKIQKRFLDCNSPNSTSKPTAPLATNPYK